MLKIDLLNFYRKNKEIVKTIVLYIYLFIHIIQIT